MCSAGLVQRDHPVLRLLCLAVACAAVFAALFAFAVRTERGQRIDEKALAGRSVVDPDELAAAADALKLANDVLGTISIGSLAVAGGALVFLALARGRILLATGVAVAIIGANVTSQLLKHRVLERPDLIDATSRLGNSFPSGHATVAMSLAVGAVLVSPRRYRGTVALAGVAYATAVAVATLLTGWHRPSDAVAGGLVAVGWGAAVAAMLVAGRGTGRDLPGFHPGARHPAMWLLTTLGAVSLVCVALVGVTVAYDGHVGDLLVVNRGRAFLLAMLVIVGCDLLLVGLLVAALRGVGLDPPRGRGRYVPVQSADPENGVSGRGPRSPSMIRSTRSL
jgi:hypothetical protein